MIPVATVDLVVTWIAAIATLGILSIIYRENPFYRFFEHLFIGVATGYGVFVVWKDALLPTWWTPLSTGSWYWVIAPLLALIFYTIYSAKYAWMSRSFVNILFGLYAGLAFRGFATQVWPQITSSFLPVRPGVATADGSALTFGAAVTNVFFLVTLISVMTYFFFSFRHGNKAVTGTAKLGRWLLMVAFGATFGSTVMARFSLLIDRIHFLLADWLHLVR